MKRLIVLLLLALLLLSVVWCRQKVCYVCGGTYTGKLYDYPTIGGPPKEMCGDCYSNIYGTRD